MGIKVIKEPSPFLNSKKKNVLLGVPWDWESAKQGARYFPSCFRQAGFVLGSSFLHDRKLDVQDLGDVSLKPKDTKSSYQIITNCAANLFDAKKRVVFLGGDHSITIPIVNGIKNKLVVIIFDAHSDALQSRSAPLSERVLISVSENKNVEKVVVVGCRSGFKDFKNKKVFFEDLVESYRGNISKKFTKILKNSDKTYVSFDFDVIEPIYIPEVSYPQPLGIEPKTAIALLSKILSEKTIGIDFVEFNPNLNEKVGMSMHNAIEIILSAAEKMGF